LSSWWTPIVVGLLMLVFIGIQSLLATDRTRRPAWIRALGRIRAAEPAAGERP
jgi:hypothetical protein